MNPFFFPLKSKALAHKKTLEQETHRKHRVVPTIHSTLDEFLAGKKRFGYMVQLKGSE